MTTVTQITNGFNSVEALLEANRNTLIESKDPLVNQQLRGLLGGLYEIQDALSEQPLSRPAIVATDTLTTSALITMLMHEMRKTNALVAVSTEFEIKQSQTKAQAKNQETMEKLKSAEEALNKANDLSDGLGIFKWIMLALSVIMVIVSVVATVCTFGAGSGAIACSVATLAISVAMVIATSVPVDGEGNSSMDLASEKMSEGIADLTKQSLIDKYNATNSVKWDDLTDAQQEEILTEAKETGDYTTMAIMITIQLAIMIAMIAVTAGRGSGNAASYTVNAAAKEAANASQSTVRAAISAAKEGFANNLPTIMKVTNYTQRATSAVQSTGQLASASTNVARANFAYENELNEAEVTRIKTLIQYLNIMDDQLLKFIKDFNASSTASWQAVGQILRTNHATNMRINAQTHGASSV